MKCKQCNEEGLTSRVEVGPGFRTAMCAVPYYDEQGRYHYHDPNTSTYTYQCSNGHEWSESSTSHCWCEAEQKGLPISLWEAMKAVASDYPVDHSGSDDDIAAT